MKKFILIVFHTLVVILFTIASGGCISTTSKTNVQRNAIVGVGTAVGAGAGYGIGKSAGWNPALSAAVGGVVGAVTTTALTNHKANDAAYQQGIDDGYILGSSDAVKRMYWLKQRLERPQQSGDGTLRYYIYESEGTTPDGRKLAPEQVAIPIYEPNRTHD
jgi:hypothetical protein